MDSKRLDNAALAAGISPSYEQSEIGPIEDWGIIPATGLHLASVSEKLKIKLNSTYI